MQKLLKSVLCAMMLVMGGCAQKTTTNKVETADLEEYETYYNTVAENMDFNDKSTNFNCEWEMTQVADGTYRYYIVMDQPVTAMYNIVAIAVENDVKYDDAIKMMPSIGIFDESKSMVPGQVDTENGFVKGIALSGESVDSSISLKLLVQWTDKAKKDTTREFIQYSLQADTSK